MIYSIVSLEDIFYTPDNFSCCSNSVRSSNPYDYIRRGYYLDNASLFGGKNYVDFESYFSGDRTSNSLDNTNI